MYVRDSFLVRAPIERVFAFLADPRVWLGIDPKLALEVSLEPDTDLRVGTLCRFSGRGTRGTWLAHLIVFDPPHRLQVEIGHEGHGGWGSTSYRLEPTTEGTLVHMEGDYQLGWLAALGVHLLWPLYRWSVTRGHRTLASKIEGWSTEQP